MTALARGARFAVIGDPVDHSFSPPMHSAAFRARKIDATYISLRVATAELGAAMARFRVEAWTGFNVTTPLKELLLAHMDRLTPDAQTAGSVNVVRLDDGIASGHNTDGAGMLDALADDGFERLHGVRALVLGAGPAARAIGNALRDAGAHVECWSRTLARSDMIGPAPSGESSLVISALPATAVIPADVIARIGPDALVVDVNYNAARSPVPAHIGATHRDGLGMLLHQGARSFEWWTGEAAPIDAMRDALARAAREGHSRER